MKTTLKFLSTPSARRATFSQFSTSRSFSDFYPRPPRGGRPLHRLLDIVHKQFLSTSSARRATLSDALLLNAFAFLSTSSARRATFGSMLLPSQVRVFLSTSSARRATDRMETEEGKNNISIHVLREEGDRTSSILAPHIGQFLSTSSARRATHRNNRP